MTNNVQAVLILSICSGLISAFMYRTDPMTMVARWCIAIRAVILLSAELSRGAWERRNRWRECLERARRETWS